MVKATGPRIAVGKREDEAGVACVKASLAIGLHITSVAVLHPHGMLQACQGCCET